MRFAGVLFDFDGVIADSEVVSARALATALSEAGLPTSVAQAIERYTGRSRDDTLLAVADQWGAAAPDDIAERIDRAASAAFADGADPVPGAIDFIDRIGELPRAIASSSGSAHIHALLRRFGLFERFAPHVYSGREHVSRGKPHPDIYRHAAAAIGVDPADAVAIEDSAIGVRAADAAGATVIGLTAASHCRAGHGAALAAAGADVVLADYRAVLRFIAEG
jgi:HAD superfamily hydrolase (TIGR01509 family)